MERINGFIDLNEFVSSKKKTSHFLFEYNDNKYFFKYNHYSNPYSELLAEELFKDFGLPCAEYDLATYHHQNGVVSKYTHQEGYNYIKICEIVEEYVNHLNEYVIKNYEVLSKMMEKEDELAFFLDEENSLEIIWDALNYRYRNRPNKEEIVSKIMTKISKLFIFDILTMQCDRNGSNIEIMESDNTVDLAPIYDNEGIFTHRLTLGLVVEDSTNYIIYSEIRKFVSMSSKEYIDEIKKNLWIISEDNLNKKFKLIENKIEYPLHYFCKESYLDRAKKHKEKIERIIIEKENSYSKGIR